MQSELKPFYKEFDDGGQPEDCTDARHDLGTSMPQCSQEVQLRKVTREDTLSSALDACNGCDEQELQLMLKDLEPTRLQEPRLPCRPRGNRGRHWQHAILANRKPAGSRWTLRKGNLPSLSVIMKSPQADVGLIEVVLARQLQVRQTWAGTVSVSGANLRRTPQTHMGFERSGLFDGGHKLNQERGEACRGQGKRHQNAAVHGQPKKTSGTAGQMVLTRQCTFAP